MVIDKQIEAYINFEILFEYQQIHSKFRVASGERAGIDTFLENANIVLSKTSINLCRDKDDNKFIECAVDCDANYIITGDKDLLVLEKYNDIGIVTPKEFLDLYNNGIS